MRRRGEKKEGGVEGDRAIGYKKRAGPDQKRVI